MANTIDERIAKLSPEKLALLQTCLSAIECVDDSKLRPLEVDIDEDVAPVRESIYVASTSIGYSIVVNGVDVIDDNIDW